eukprot:TRINITY_DN117_c0_g2_i1.p1 TRINITY_DN117_c0_g2~~TRINITY_DN117_c0_g2_i1.p1  ORF type:complete len:149 (-),score=28.05 TRINITY_DN117_c0_g2_i1:86-532(-)
MSTVTVKYFKTTSGGTTCPQVIGPRVGPFGVPLRRIIDQVRELANENPVRKTFKITIVNRVGSIEEIDTNSSLILKSIHGNDGVKDISMERVVEIGIVMMDKNMSLDVRQSVLQVLGTCQSIECLVDGEEARNVVRDIRDGVIDIVVE